MPFFKKNGDKWGEVMLWAIIPGIAIIRFLMLYSKLRTKERISVFFGALTCTVIAVLNVMGFFIKH